jgi:nicotinamidase-related amidase
MMNKPGESPFVSVEDSVLVVIDIQERLLPAVCQQEKVLSNAKRLLALAETLSLPVVVTEQEKLGPTVGEISRSVQRFLPTCI